MPLLRRRGVMASESDMRRHTTVLDPDTVAAATAADPADQNGGNLLKPSLETIADTPPPGRASHDPFDRPESPPIQEETPKHRRFSMLRFRNASDSQLSARMKAQAEKPPPMPQPPAIITTAPTMDSNASSKKSSRMKVPLRIRRSSDLPRGEQVVPPKSKAPQMSKKDKRKSSVPGIPSFGKQNVTFEEPSRPNLSSSSLTAADQATPGLSLPMNRLSESSRSEASFADHPSPAQTPSTSSSSFFRLARRKQKQPEPLFPLAHLPQKSKTPGLTPTVSNTPSLHRDSTSTSIVQSTPRLSADDAVSPGHVPGNWGKPAGSPATALFKPTSRTSGQSSPTRTHLSARGRSSTLGSLGEGSLDPHLIAAGRTSSSAGRKSFGDLLGLSRMRQNTETSRQGSLTPVTPGSNGSKNNSLQLTRGPVILPERREDDTPAKYLARVEGVVNRGVIAAALSKGSDSFSASVLRSYMRSFSFFEEPMDMAIRKLLMEAELPKETQQIDRCLQAFANRYHECNPGIYSSPDQAYFIAFSLLILHTDVFNKNNKYKMQKTDYLKNTSGEGISDDVLECFYDNITYTPFIHVEDEFQANGDRNGSYKKKKAKLPNSTDPGRKSKEPIDPYTLIIDGKLDSLRPPIKDQIPLEEHYSYLGTAHKLNLKELQKTFFKTGVLQIVSARSRPDAFMTEKTQNNPQAAHPGIVDIKVTKVGTLWRKEAKKKKTRSPWQEWGAILTGAQLYFFRNTAWVKSLVHQYESHLKSGQDGTPLVFKPPLESFSPDVLMSTDGAVALWDTNYKKHKNAFVYVRHGGLEEVLLAQSEDDRNDWLAKLNYAAAFKTSGVRMRGLVGGNYEGQSRRAIRRLDTTDTTQLIQTPTGEVTINRGKIDHQMAHDILHARRNIMRQRISEAEDSLQEAQKELDTQLRNARHLLVLAPIQERTREQVRAGASKIIAQLKWCRTELYRLKCHRDVLALDLAEELDLNGDLGEHSTEPVTEAVKPTLSHKTSRSSAHLGRQQSTRAPAPLSLSQAPSSESLKQAAGGSPESDVFQTPPTTATAPTFPDGLTTASDREGARKSSVSSAASKPAAVASPLQLASSPGSCQEEHSIYEQADEDAHERQVLEQAGLLDLDSARSADPYPSSSGHNLDEVPDWSKRPHTPKGDKDKSDASKLRKSLQKTLRDGAGHLAHHRSRKGKDSASSGGLSDDTVRDEILSRGAGSFTVHGKKASVINFGSELQGISPDKQRRHIQEGDDQGPKSPTEGDDDFHSVLGDRAERKERKDSGASASTATARSFRELHRKYSSSRSHRTAGMGGGGLTVPSDEESDAAVSFSEGRRSPLPPLDDDDEDEGAVVEVPSQAEFYTPDRPLSPAEPVAAESNGESGERKPTS
ncbi:hypothetical protein F4780DRAFT_665518 [Xylariomycetidae sp. FL0641]|nr:hypothetical protein F4780DRAFT_665518 [Xylariomycetidae sp. FL0641]